MRIIYRGWIRRCVEIVYDTKCKILRNESGRVVKLTYREYKLLICLSSGKVERYEEILKELSISMNELERLRKRFIVDTGLDVKELDDGYKLEGEIYFE